jgi:Glycosyl hydrolase family 9
LKSRQLFEFGDKYRGKYDKSVRAVKSYYPSVSGYGDELLWAALWLHWATGSDRYVKYVVKNGDEFGGTGWAVSEFSWDIKYAGLQVLASKVFPLPYQYSLLPTSMTMNHNFLPLSSMLFLS